MPHYHQNQLAQMEQLLGKPLQHVKFFERDEQPFKAMRLAEDLCREMGFSVGSMQREAPIGIRRGSWTIWKWRNLDALDQRELDGVILGESKRYGPITVAWHEPNMPVPECLL